MVQCRKCGNALPPEAKFCPRCGAAVETTAAYAAPAGPKLAFWGERFVAWLIDIIIVNVALFLVGLVFLFPWFTFGPEPFRNWSIFINVGANGVVLFLYWMFTEAAYGKSIGKSIMSLRVARLDGARINFGQAALESVGKAFLLPIGLLIGWLLYPRRRQRIFNFISETVVVHE
jgi:uncharacterized RDD family membrane protein YckC